MHDFSIDNFYQLSKIILIKDEKYYDRFDQLFGNYIKNLEHVPENFMDNIPPQWLENALKGTLSEQEKQKIQAIGDLEKLMAQFKKIFEEQKEKHSGGSKWIGTGGTSPFGAFGYNPEGIRIGQNKSNHRKAVKVWDQRNYQDLDDNIELNTRNFKLALKRLRNWTQEGPQDQLDIEKTIKKTATGGGLLEVVLKADKKNRVKVLMLMDIGGSMDDHIEICSRLFSAAKHQFKHLEFYYFHNCLYESVWKHNARGKINKISTYELLKKYNSDYKLIVVGDASMSPYEIMYPGGSVEHYNAETGLTWLNRLKNRYKSYIWLNPMDQKSWPYTPSVQMIYKIFEEKMFPLSLSGINKAMQKLQK